MEVTNQDNVKLLIDRLDDIAELEGRVGHPLFDAFNNEHTLHFELHNHDHVVTASGKTKHVSVEGEIKELKSGTKYRIDKNGCWRKIEEV